LRFVAQQDLRPCGNMQLVFTRVKAPHKKGVLKFRRFHVSVAYAFYEAEAQNHGVS
jgi:hypothetical protein